MNNFNKEVFESFKNAPDISLKDDIPFDDPKKRFPLFEDEEDDFDNELGLIDDEPFENAKYQIPVFEKKKNKKEEKEEIESQLEQKPETAKERYVRETQIDDAVNKLKSIQDEIREKKRQKILDDRRKKLGEELENGEEEELIERPITSKERSLRDNKDYRRVSPYDEAIRVTNEIHKEDRDKKRNEQLKEKRLENERNKRIENEKKRKRLEDEKEFKEGKKIEHPKEYDELTLEDNTNNISEEERLETIVNEMNNITRIMMEINNHYEVSMLALNEDIALNYKIISESTARIEIERNGGYFLQSLAYVIKQNLTVPIIIKINAFRPILKNGELINEEVTLRFSSGREFIDGEAMREYLGDEETDEGWDFYLENENGVRTKIVPPGKFLRDIEIWVPKVITERQRITGAFIPYCLKEEFNYLKELYARYDIYNEKDCIRNNNTNCFFICCKNANIFNDDELTFIKSQINDHFVPFTKLTPLFVKLDTRIILNYYSNGKAETKYVNKTGKRLMRIYMIRLDGFSHYFINELINYPFNDNKRVGKITSYEFISMGIEKGVLNKMNSDTLFSCRMGLLDKVEIKLASNQVLFSKEIKCNEKKEKDNVNIFFADLECITSTEKHLPYCGIIQYETDVNTKEFYGFECCQSILNYVLTKCKIGSIIIYFHNLTYDGRFFAKYGIISSIEKDSRIYSLTLRYRERIITLKDSFAIIPTALKNFNSMFDLGVNNEKEIYPYNFITKDNYKIASIDGVGDNESPEWNDDKKKEFKDKLIKMKLLDNDKWNVEEYTKYYCRRDVNILRNGFNKFRKMCKEELKIDPLSFLSLSSIAYYYFKRNAFEGENLYEYTGNVREYMRKAVYGGRCMTNRNQKMIVEDIVVDFDACSLYPSAMSRLYLPKGIPKTLEVRNDTKCWLMEHLMGEKDVKSDENKFISCFIVTIKITKCGKDLDFPLIVKKVNGVNFNVNENDITMTVDNIYLEDLIKYHKIDYEVIDGIYWVGDKSTKLSEEIKKVYDLRNHYKRIKNAMQNIYKLIMNSSYGKTIQKPSLKEILYKKESELQTYWVNNYFNIIKGEKVYESDVYRIEKRTTIDEEYVPIIIGVLILSMSKRIMNELFDCAENKKLKIFYQDTDSIHIKQKDLETLVSEFETKFERKLIGTEMGQFHTDFENIKDNSSNVVSEKSIFLGKKAYIDCLKDDQGNKKDQVRMKGVPSINIIEKGKEYNNCWELYKRLYNGDTIEFDLIKYGPHFKLYKSMEVESLRCFKRKVRFGNKSEDKVNRIREETIKDLIERNKTFVAQEFMAHHELPEILKQKMDVRNYLNSESDESKLNRIYSVYELLSKYILYMYFCYTIGITEDTVGYVISKLYECSEIISKLYHPLNCLTDAIDELNNRIIGFGITKINNNYVNDVFENYDEIMLFKTPITFSINEPNIVAEKILENYKE